MATTDRRTDETAARLAEYADLLADPHTKWLVVHKRCGRERGTAWARQYLSEAEQVWVDPDNTEVTRMRAAGYELGYAVVAVYLDEEGQLVHIS